jgi:hypothetical protein
MKDLTVILEDKPGALADLGDATAGADINIEGMCGTTAGEIHILVEDADATREALEGAGMEVSGEREVLVLELEDRPGTMADVARKLGDAGINVELVYTTFGEVREAISDSAFGYSPFGHAPEARMRGMVFGVADVDAARAVL